jgi:hypothetical protein
MMTQKAMKTKSTLVIKNAEKITDQKTRRKYKKMFKQTARRKQRLLEKKEAKRMVNEYEVDRWVGEGSEYTTPTTRS